MNNVKDSSIFKGKINEKQVRQMVTKSLEILDLQNYDDSLEFQDSKEKRFKELWDLFWDWIYFALNLPPFHYPHHVLLDNESYAGKNFWSLL